MRYNLSHTAPLQYKVLGAQKIPHIKVTSLQNVFFSTPAMTDSSIYLYSISNNFIQRFNSYNIYQYRYYYIIVRGDTFGTKVYNIDEKTTFMICARSMYM